VLQALPATPQALAAVPVAINDTLAAACLDEVVCHLLPGLRAAALPLLPLLARGLGPGGGAAAVLRRAAAVGEALAAAQQVVAQQQQQLALQGEGSAAGPALPHRCCCCCTRRAASSPAPVPVPAPPLRARFEACLPGTR
jgi:hypothetical protein